MAITVSELVAVPFLQLRFLAGSAGGRRMVAWAHCSDLPNATDWLGPGDFLMSNGLSLPAGGDEQVEFLRGLDSAGLSGLGIGEDMHSPPISEAFLAHAEELAFPVIAIPHEVPFVAVSRAVASANSDEEHGRLVRVVQLYDSLRGEASAEQLLKGLGHKLGCRLLLIDIATTLPAVDGHEPIPDALRARLGAELGARGGAFPGVLRMTESGASALAIHVPAERPTALVALHEPGEPPELALLHHAANVAALGAERVTTEREQALRRGTELLAQMLEHRHEPAAALHELAEGGLDPEWTVLVSFEPADSAAAERDLHHELAQRRLPHLLHWEPRRALVAIRDGDEDLSALRAAIGTEPALGISDPLGRPDRAPDAAREARWAQTAAHTLAKPIVRYGESTPLFLPRTLGEAEMAANRVLGPILEYDEAHGTDLLNSLAVFLEHNRSWQRSAELLHVHKQTLVYRMRRVEELARRNLQDTSDVAQLWLALQAREFARSEPP